MILPQALRRLLPPLVGLLVNIIQNTTIAQVIGAPELLEASERQVERLTFEGEEHAYRALRVLFLSALTVPATLAAQRPAATPRAASAQAGVRHR